MTKSCPRCHKRYDQDVQFCPDDGALVSARDVLDPAVAVALAPDYRILDWLGSGGIGNVYLAEQVRVGNRKVALKVLHRKFSEDAEFIGRFQNEAASTGRINHPNVITIYESQQAPDGTLYIAMELVEGESLSELLRRRGTLPLDEVVGIVTQCCKALAAAHRLGIIHRDVKPDNIMLTQDADGALLVKILDFGIAKLKDSSGHTMTGSVLGTPAYMSYEQASGLASEKLDGRSDIYSLGVVTYHMLVGHPPFRAETPVGYITKHLSETPASLQAQRSDLLDAVEAVVKRALEKDRDRRYQTAAEFAAALREAAKAPAPSLSSPAAPVAPPPPPWRPRPLTTDDSGEGRASPLPAAPSAPVTLSPVAPAPPGSDAASGPRPVITPSAPRPDAAASTAAPRGTGAVVDRLRPREPALQSAVRERRSVVRDSPRGGDDVAKGLAAALWGLRHGLSWLMRVYAVACLVLFGWPLVAPAVDPALIAPVETLGRPVIQPIAQWVPGLTIGGLDLLPLLVAVALLIGRRRVVSWLAALEERWRARVVSEEVFE